MGSHTTPLWAIPPKAVAMASGAGRLLDRAGLFADVAAAVQQAPQLWRGLAWAAVAAATWTAFGLFTARWVQRHP
jgi:tRNA C32,U32 (ribose-2'-O)-methylase TrmJ